MATSIIIPCEQNRLKLLEKTIETYWKFSKVPQDVEFVIVSRNIKPFTVWRTNIKFLHYRYPGEHINPAIAFNIGVDKCMSEDIIITSPEVKPITDVLKQFKELGRGNYLAQVWDMNEDGTRRLSLVNKKFRGYDPSMYFLAQFRREDIYDINGWDENFMEGTGYEDNDFGFRFKKAGFPFEVREEIQAEHQYHDRIYDNEKVEKNRLLFLKKKQIGEVKCKNGIKRYKR